MDFVSIKCLIIVRMLYYLQSNLPPRSPFPLVDGSCVFVLLNMT